MHLRVAAFLYVLLVTGVAQLEARRITVVFQNYCSFSVRIGSLAIDRVCKRFEDNYWLAARSEVRSSTFDWENNQAFNDDNLQVATEAGEQSAFPYRIRSGKCNLRILVEITPKREEGREVVSLQVFVNGRKLQPFLSSRCR